MGIQFDSFYQYEQLSAYLQRIEAEYDQYVNVTTLTQTKEGRNVYVVEVTDSATGTADSKSAYYIQAGLHAMEGAGVTAALHVLQSLLSEELNRDLLKEVAFYIVPCVDPDGMEYTLTTHAEIRSRYAPTGRKNELIPQDVNGDGYVLQMRWKDPAGPYKEHPNQPGLMVKREVGDRGEAFYQVVQEGMVWEHDGSRAVHPIRQEDFNRSYPALWRTDGNSTAYPFSQPEMKAIGDFMLAHPNIFAGVDFHCGTHAILPTDCKAPHEFPWEDWGSIVQVGKMAERITGLPYTNPADYGFGGNGSKTYGDSNDWAYMKLGISHYVVEVGFGLTSLGLSANEILSSDEKTREEYVRRLIAMHEERGNPILTPWEVCDHPQLGEVEIGGMMVGNARFMDPNDMRETAPKTTEFVLKHAAMRPHIIFATAEAVALGGGLYRIRADVGNIGGFSTEVMKGGGGSDMKHPVSIRLIEEGLEVFSRNKIYELQSLAPLGGSIELEWFVKMDGEQQHIVIEASHPRAGIVRQQVDL